MILQGADFGEAGALRCTRRTRGAWSISTNLGQFDDVPFWYRVSNDRILVQPPLLTLDASHAPIGSHVLGPTVNCLAAQSSSSSTSYTTTAIRSDATSVLAAGGRICAGFDLVKRITHIVSKAMLSIFSLSATCLS